MNGTKTVTERNNNYLISIIVTNYNGKEFLEAFLNSVFSQTYKNIEVIIVDNNSIDESIKFIEKKFPKVKIIKNKENYGYAKGNNLGLIESSGEFVVIANNDTILESDLLEKLLIAYDKIPNLGAVQPMVKLIDNKKNLDACGSFWTNTGFNYHYGIYKNSDLSIYNKSFPVYSLKGVFMMIPRKIIDKIGLFDNDFWCYFEETDFCHRIWLAGYECWYYPESFLYHYLGGTSNKKPNEIIQFHSFKNRLCSYLKNLSILELIKILPIYFFMNFFWSIGYFFKGSWKNFLIVYKAIWWNIKNIKNTFKKRMVIQKEVRKKTDKEIFSKTKKNPRLSYYFYLLKGLKYYED